MTDHVEIKTSLPGRSAVTISEVGVATLSRFFHLLRRTGGHVVCSQVLRCLGESTAMSASARIRLLLLVLGLSALLAACGGVDSQDTPPAQVSVVTVETAPAAIVTELPGRLNSTRVAEVRARVPGIVLERVFTEGGEVKAGDVLFRIDPEPLRAALASAQAAVAQAEANAFQANALAQRYEPLIKANAISSQEYDGALAAQRQTRAVLQSARAALDVARINLNYATVTAPISGRIGRALVTEGALVGQGAVTPLATVQQLDPIYADFTQSASDLLRLRRALERGEMQHVDREVARVSLILDDGSEYPLPGELLFSDIAVNPSTGQVSLRGVFPNPDKVLLPGSYVRVRLKQAIAERAIRIPQQAVQRDGGGRAFVTVAEPARDEQGKPLTSSDGKPPRLVAARRTVRLGSTLGDTWIIEDGLQPGERVIVEGVQRATPGTVVIASPWQMQRTADAASPQKDQTRAAAGSGADADGRPDGSSESRVQAQLTQR
jgi:membrane fusion protein (multidrug efflux system)